MEKTQKKFSNDDLNEVSGGNKVTVKGGSSVIFEVTYSLSDDKKEMASNISSLAQQVLTQLDLSDISLPSVKDLEAYATKGKIGQQGVMRFEYAPRKKHKWSILDKGKA